MSKRLIIYSTKKHLLFKLVKFPRYEIGDITSYGYLVIDIQFYYKGRFYSKMEYINLLEIESSKNYKSFLFKKKIINVLTEISNILK